METVPLVVVGQQAAEPTGAQLPELVVALLVVVLLAAPVAAAVALVIALRRRDALARLEALEERVAAIEERQRRD